MCFFLKASHFCHSYYRRFKLYKYVLTSKVIMEFKQVHPNEVEYPMRFNPLSQGIMLLPTDEQ